MNSADFRAQLRTQQAKPPMTTTTTKNTLTICLVGISCQADLERAIRTLHAYNPSFTTSRLEIAPHRRMGSFVVHTTAEVTAFLDDVGDLFGQNHETPVAWPAPRGDKLSPTATPFVYPPTITLPDNAVTVA